MTQNHLIADQFEACQKVLQAMGDENRQSLILALMRTELSKGLRVLELTDLTHLSRPAVARHLRILQDAGIVKYHKEGTKGYYMYEPEPDVVDVLSGFANASNGQTRQQVS